MNTAATRSAATTSTPINLNRSSRLRRLQSAGFGQRLKDQENAHSIYLCIQALAAYLRWRSTRSISCSKDAAAAAT
jgi:hypothetical protein